MALIYETYVGNALRRWRQALGLNQTQAATMIGWHPTVMNQIESGKLRMSTTRALELERGTNGSLTAIVLLYYQMQEEVAELRVRMKIPEQPTPPLYLTHQSQQ